VNARIDGPDNLNSVKTPLEFLICTEGVVIRDYQLLWLRAQVAGVRDATVLAWEVSR
jgi:hypothetical protein